jgi:replicative DNA helicase
MAFMSKCRVAKQKYDLGLIILDYLQLMTRRKNENDAQAVGSNARTVRKTARLLEIPIIEVCQVSRNCEYRDDKRPILSDLKESGDIEQEADIVLALYRDEYYHPEKSKTPGVCEVIVRKHRNGSLGTVYLHFKSETTRFFQFFQS